MVEGAKACRGEEDACCGGAGGQGQDQDQGDQGEEEGETFLVWGASSDAEIQDALSKIRYMKLQLVYTCTLKATNFCVRFIYANYASQVQVT